MNWAAISYRAMSTASGPVWAISTSKPSRSSSRNCTEARLAANGEERAALGGFTSRLEAMLAEIHRILADPRNELKLAPSSLRVDRLGIKQEGGQGAGSPANDLSLLECTTSSSQRVIALVRCPRDELLTLDQIVAQVEPYLASQMGIRAA